MEKIQIERIEVIIVVSMMLMSGLMVIPSGAMAGQYLPELALNNIGYVNISAADAQQLLMDENEDIFLLDVRTLEEFTQMSISGAYLIPYDELLERSSELPSDLDKTIIVYCAAGGRSVIASETLVEMEYTNVMNMVGGISAWTEYIYSLIDMRYLEGEERDDAINIFFDNEDVQILLLHLEEMMYIPLNNDIVTRTISYPFEESGISITCVLPFESLLNDATALISYTNHNEIIHVSATTIDQKEATLFMTDYIVIEGGSINESSSSYPMSYFTCDNIDWDCVIDLALAGAGFYVAGCAACTAASYGLCYPCFVALAAITWWVYKCELCLDPPAPIYTPSPYPYVPGATGNCPYICVWDGDEYLYENSILTDSENYDREDMEITEYYKLQGTPVLKDGNYSFLITEFENHHTLLDQVELLTIDHDGTVDIDVSRDGGIYTISDSVILPNSAIDKYGIDRSIAISSMYSSKYCGYPGDFLELNFGAIGETSSTKLIFRSDIKPGGTSPSPISIDPLYDPYLTDSIDNLLNFDISKPIKINVKNDAGELTHITDIYPRPTWATDIIDLTSYLPTELDGDLIVNLSWEGRHDLDYVALDISDEVQTEINQYQLSNAEVTLQDCGCGSGCANENLRSTLLSDDGWYADKLVPGKQIEITFPYNEISESMEERDLIFIFKGFYKELMNIDVSSDINVEITQDSVDTVTAYFVEWDGVEYDFIDSITTEPIGPSSANIVRHPKSEDLMFIEYNAQQPLDTYTYTTVNIEITSVMGTKNIELLFTPSDGLKQTTILSLKLEFDEVTGLSYNVTSKVLTANSGALPLEFEIYPEPTSEVFELDSLRWKFGDGSYSAGLTTTHSYTSTGIYFVNGYGIYQNIQGDDYSFTTIESAWYTIEVVNEFPIPEIEVYEVVDIDLRVTGRKGNTVTLEIYEDGSLINQLPVTRTPGVPNMDSITLNKHLDREYTFVLIYDAVHMGENPSWITFESGDNREIFFFEFVASEGMHQELAIDAFYLDNVVQGNTQYFFDASNSYDIDGEIVSYAWNFGDGYSATGALVSHIYTTPEPYTVTLTVTDNEGAKATITYIL